MALGFCRRIRAPASAVGAAVNQVFGHAHSDCAVGLRIRQSMAGGRKVTESERKKRKREQDRARSMTRVALKGEKERWDQLKADCHLETDEDVAKLLLDS